ncbi:MAG TPA: DUF883 family protein [Opitutus sp.]|nr:DUF883 family protein [Opitutus sp.]
METHFPTISDSPAGLARRRMLDDLRTLATDAEALVRATASDASDKAKEARNRLAATIDKAKSTYEQMQAQGLSSAKAAARSADDTVREHPYESVGIAFGAGLLIGVLFGRQSFKASFAG